MNAVTKHEIIEALRGPVGAIGNARRRELATRIEQHGIAPPALGDMALRDYFAAKAMQGIIHNEADIDFSGKTVESAVASLSYRIADAMLAEREKGGER